MKLAKLSLAAIMAAGALSTASAQPLEEAIKGVDFTGFIEYTSNTVETDGVNGGSGNDWDVLGKVTAPVTDNLKAVVAFATTTGDTNSQSDAAATQPFDLAKAFFIYKQDALTVKAGLQAIGAPTTDNGFNGQKGNGAVALYSAGPVTLAGAYFNNTNIYSKSDVAAVAIIGSMGPVSGQAWYVQIPGAVDSHYVVELSAAMAGATIKGQYISTKLDAAGAETGKFYGVKVGYAIENVTLGATYTNNDEDQGVHAVSNDGDNDVIASGWRLQNSLDTSTLDDTYGIDVGATFGKIGVVAGYANAEIIGGNEEADEFYVGASYKVSKNFSSYIRYSDVSYDVDDTQDFNYFRFEAKYTF